MHVVKHHGFSTIIMGCRVGLVSLKEPVRKQMFVPNVPNQACWRIRCCFPALKKPESRWPEPDQWQICSYGAHFSLSGDSKPVSFWSSLFFSAVLLSSAVPQPGFRSSWFSIWKLFLLAAAGRWRGMKTLVTKRGTGPFTFQTCMFWLWGMVAAVLSPETPTPSFFFVPQICLDLFSLFFRSG